MNYKNSDYILCKSAEESMFSWLHLENLLVEAFLLSQRLSQFNYIIF